MRIGIIGAMAIEVDQLKEQMEQAEQRVISGVTFYKGFIGETETVVAQAGIGKVNAAICAQTMILVYEVDAIVNTGVAGGYRSLNVGDVVVATAVVEHDMDTSPVGDPKGYISGVGMIQMPADNRIAAALYEAAESCGAGRKMGIVASGDQFICSTSQAQRISQEFNAVAYEMEGAAIGHVCTQNRVPFGVIRVLSDNGDDGAAVDYQTFAPVAANRSIQIVLRFLAGLAR